MARFTIRVQLHNATWEHYKKLYPRMAAEGFTDEIQSQGGTWYRMPDAEYSYEGTDTIGAVRDKARRAASGVVNSYAVLVTESAGRVWYGLDVIE
jgi:hypothetical protein